MRLLLFIALTGAPLAASAATVEPTTVPASDSASAVVRVETVGRYAVTATSATGVALTLVDAAVGPVAFDGAAGKRDGRIDAILDVGDYLVRTSGDPAATGIASLSVHPFTAVDSAPSTLAAPHPHHGQLRDRQRATFHVDIGERDYVVVEAVGRSLADLRLWRDGWLDAAEPARDLIEPVAGQPLTRCRLVARVEPGAYELVAYGGPAQPWAADDGHPLHVRLGLQLRAQAGRERRVMSPFGTDVFVVPSGTNSFRLELEAPASASLRVAEFSPSEPFAPPPWIGNIDKRTIPPVTELELDVADIRAVTVETTAGRPYVIEHFLRSEPPFVPQSGQRWIDTLNPGDPRDGIDATAVIVRTPRRGQQRHEVVAAATVPIAPSTPWRRRFNLLTTRWIIVDVESTGSYQLRYRGEPARARVEPFFVATPDGYESPPLREGARTLDLDAGRYVITFEPLNAGVVEVDVRSSDDPPVDWDAPIISPVRPSARLGAVTVDAAFSHRLLMADPTASVGVVDLPRPVVLGRPLPLGLAPGEVVTIDVKVSTSSDLHATSESGAPVAMSLDGDDWSDTLAVATGSHEVRLRLDGGPSTFALLSAVPVPPAAAAATTGSAPGGETLTAGRPLFFDLDRDASRSFAVQAEDDALYSVSTTGLLAVEGALESRTRPRLARGVENGVGRNVSIRSWLRPGTYRANVRTRGPSRGHLGLRLDAAPLTSAGSLVADPSRPVAARTTLAPGTATAYTLEITHAGRYRIDALALGTTPRGRLEDDRGWPLVASDSAVDWTLDLEAGRHRLILLPGERSMRVVTRVENIDPTPPSTGHGPHTFRLDATASHVWLETDLHDTTQTDTQDVVRTPDVWHIEIPADIAATIGLTTGMHGRLYRVADPERREVAYVAPGRGYHGPIAAGAYELEVTSVRRDNRRPYELHATAAELVVGTSRAIVAPATIDVAVAERALVVLESTGGDDIRAELVDADGRELLSGDDRDHDWNVHLTGHVDAGRYQLRVAPVGAASASTTVHMRSLRAEHGAPITLPLRRSATFDGVVRTYPLRADRARGVVTCTASAASEVGIALERRLDGNWRTVATRTGSTATAAVAIDGFGDDELRLAVWSPDPRPLEVSLIVERQPVRDVTEADLARGVTAAAGEALRIALDRPGVLSLALGSNVAYADRISEPLRSATGQQLLAHGSTLWLVADAGARVRATRQTVRRADPQRVILRPGDRAQVDFETGAATLAVIAARATSGQLGLDVAGAPITVDRNVALTTSHAAPGTHSTATHADVWRADTLNVGTEVDLELFTYDTVIEGGPLDTPIDVAVEPATAHRWQLSGEKSRLRLTLDAGLVATLYDGERALGVHGAPGQATDSTLRSRATAITIASIASDARRARIEQVPDNGATIAPLTSARAHADRHRTAGTFLLRVEPDRDTRQIRVRGEVRSATWVGDDGSVQFANAMTDAIDLPMRGAGELRVRHGAGLVACMLADADGRLSWSNVQHTRAMKLDPPATVLLSGPHATFDIATHSPTMLHVRADPPVVAAVETTGGDEVGLYPHGFQLDRYVADGTQRIGLAPLDGRELSGELTVTTSMVATLGEGLGPEVMLPPGGTRAFSFDLDAKRTVGVGARGSSDTVVVELRDLAGHLLGSGNVLMAELDAGTYLVLLRAPSDGPARVRPAIAGVDPPDTGPPDDVIRSYIGRSTSAHDRDSNR